MSEKQAEKIEETKMSEKQDEKIEENIKPVEKKKGRAYQVVVNQEEQYALWAADQEIPNGWESVGPKGDKEVCLAYVKEVWTDMRPKSLR